VGAQSKVSNHALPISLGNLNLWPCEFALAYCASHQVAIAISYLDRQTLPVAIKAIERDIPVSNQQFSLLQNRVPPHVRPHVCRRRPFDGLSGHATWVFRDYGLLVVGLCLSRPCGGVSVCSRYAACARRGRRRRFSSATRAITECPVKERSTAMGIINAEARGNDHCPPLIALVLSFLSWRWIFLFAAAAVSSGPLVAPGVLPAGRAPGLTDLEPATRAP